MGCKHCGKTTQGKKYASYIGADFYDLDEVIEKKCGMSVRDYFNKYGKEGFIEIVSNTHTAFLFYNFIKIIEICSYV